MIYLFHGEDAMRSLNKLNETMRQLLKKAGSDAPLFEINEENFDESYFKNLIYSNHLFGEKNLVALKRVFENKTLSDYFTKRLGDLNKSPHIFIFWEEALNKEILALFQREARKIWQFKKLKKLDEKQELEKTREEKNAIFQFIDAFSEKKPRFAWFLFQKLLMSGVDEEEIFWKIFWQTKNLAGLKPEQNAPFNLIVQKSKLHPYVVKKCLKVLPIFDKEKLEELSKNLLEIYQNNRYNKIELSFGIEKMLLNL